MSDENGRLEVVNAVEVGWRDEREGTGPLQPEMPVVPQNVGEAEPGGQDGESEREKANRRNGNVARLPKAVRDRINRMIEDGVTYPEIIKSLGEDGNGLVPSCLTRWRKGGYQDWLAEQAFILKTRARQETPSELVRDFDATEVNHAALQLGSLHVFEALRELEPGSLNKKLGGDCAAFARLLNALARASRETMLVQRYREACAQARNALKELKDPSRKLNENETRAIVLKVDNILGLNGEVEEQGTGSGQGAKESEPGKETKQNGGSGTLPSPAGGDACATANEERN